MAVEQCWLALAVVPACRVFIFFGFFSFSPSSLEAFGVWWKRFKQVPFNLKAFPALFLPTCCFQACSLWTAATISHKGDTLSLGMENPTWKTPGEELACGVKCISSRGNMKCTSSRWNNPLAMGWKCLPGGNSERGAARKMRFLLSLAWFLILDSLKLCTCFSGRAWFEEKQSNSFWTDGAAKKGGREVAQKQREMERGIVSDSGSSKPVRNDVSQPLKWARELVVRESHVNKKKTCVNAQGLSFHFSGTNESRQVAATYWTQSQALFLSFSPHPELPFFGATTQTSSRTPGEVWELGNNPSKSGNLGTTHPSLGT